MKKLLSIFAVTAVFAACNNNPKAGTDTATSVAKSDTATATHSAFTDKAQEVQLNGVSDTIVSANGNTYVKVTPKESEAAPAKSMPVIKERSTVHHTTTHAKQPVSSASRAGTAKSDSSSTVSNSKSGTSAEAGTKRTDTATTTTTTTETKKKGWSKAAKGAVIGAGSGAAVGAIISRKKGKGAIIGGIIGGAGGYLFGKNKDKKDDKNNPQ